MHIAPLTEADLDALSALLIETVAANGSVGFMHPLAEADARAFWSQALASASRGERIVLGAWRGDQLVGTGTLVLLNNNFYQGVTNINEGTLQLGNGGASGSLLATGKIINNGKLIIDRAGTTSFNGPISGTGSLIKNGTGTFNYGGQGVFTGGIVVNSGTLGVQGTGTLPSVGTWTINTGGALKYLDVLR